MILNQMIYWMKKRVIKKARKIKKIKRKIRKKIRIRKVKINNIQMNTTMKK